MRRRLPALSLALSLSLSSVLARAGDDAAAAQALFNDAKKLMASGKYADACPKLAESQRLSPAVGTKFNLADCYEHTGRLASAWAGFLSVAAAAKNANQGPREKAARDWAAALEPKLPRLAVGVPQASRVQGIEVKRDGETIGDAEWGEAMPVDPGEHVITATAPGKRAWKGIVEVQGAASVADGTSPASPGRGLHVTVLVPPLDDEPPPAPPPDATASAPAAPAAAASTQTEVAIVQPPSKTPAWILVGVGGAALVGGGVAWAMRGSALSKLNGECGSDGQSCPPSATNDIANGKTYDALGVGLFAAGAVCAVVGVTWLVVGGKGEARTTAWLTPVAGPSGGGVTASASF